MDKVYGRADEIELTKLIYKQNGEKLFSRLPATIKILLINGRMFKNPLELIDKSGAHLTSLEFTESCEFSVLFDNTEESSYPNMLTQLRTLKAGVDSLIQVFIRNIVSTNMTTLELSIDSNEAFPLFNLDWPLSIFPSLKTLVINFSGAVFIGKEMQPGRLYPNLQNLSIKNANTDENLFEYIEIVAPNLRGFGYPLLTERYQYLLEKRLKKQFFWAHPGTPYADSVKHVIKST